MMNKGTLGKKSHIFFFSYLNWTFHWCLPKKTIMNIMKKMMVLVIRKTTFKKIILQLNKLILRMTMKMVMKIMSITIIMIIMRTI